MSKNPVFCFFLLMLASAAVFSGCTSPQAAPLTPAATPAVVDITLMPTPPPDVPAPEKTPVVTKPVTTAASEKVLITTKGMISPSEYKTFDFKTMGHQFLQIGEKYRITIRADKPVIGYAVLTEQASQLTGNTLVPHYVPHSENIQWGQIEPYLVVGQTTESTKTFTVEELGPYTYVVDARWMLTDDDYKATAPFNYEITIAKITT